MITRLTRILVASVCLLPAIPLQGARALDAREDAAVARASENGGSGIFLVIPTFISGCEQFPPRVRTTYVGVGKPVPRPRHARVEVFLAGNPPPRPSVVLGEVEVLTRSRNTSLDNLLEYAASEARKLGGDALVDVTLRPAMVEGHRVDTKGRRVLTANIVRME